MNLLELIDTLQQLNQNLPIINAQCDGDSYRGNYYDFAIEPNLGEVFCTVKDMVDYLENDVLDKVYYGYKGGKYIMSGDVDIYLATYGETGEKIVGIAILKDGYKFLTEEEMW